MPLLADAIVDAAARTLTGAFRLANEWGQDEKGQWFGAQVIYGDTDSVFVKLPGRSVQEAFRFGKEFCAAVTANNPPPVQLKLEKVYLGSIMQTVRELDLLFVIGCTGATTAVSHVSLPFVEETVLRNEV